MAAPPTSDERWTSYSAAVGATFAGGLGFASLAPMIIGWIATVHSILAGLPLLALCSSISSVGRSADRANDRSLP